ncbi:hypothetical protein CH370_09675 [Leptospira kmetyi]|uniref:restriction endonuclease n=1 Tax=Leptospira kmetyi TaxID=408139 RepID=UPI000C2A20BC|nr:restriction endonuclease [Leptospira kmetyi]PJZ41698.1 hypothetical protein CH370_09675 [Leptospira kmetyi]
MTWQEYEEKIFGYFKNRYPEGKLTKNAKILGRSSKSLRQIDILLEQDILGNYIGIAIECKNWNHKLDVADIGSFIHTLEDTGLTRGIIISKSGFTEGAINMARDTFKVQLHVIDFDKLKDHQGFFAFAYRGQYGALLTAPNGWVIDSKVPKDYFSNMVCFMYPMEMSAFDASHKRHFIYLNIEPCEDSLEAVYTHLKHQDDEMKKKDPTMTIEYWEENFHGKKIIFRQIGYVEKDYIEFTVALFTDGMLFYIVNAVPKNYIPDDVSRIRYIMNTILMIHLKGVDPTNSHPAWKKLIEKHFGMNHVA